MSTTATHPPEMYRLGRLRRSVTCAEVGAALGLGVPERLHPYTIERVGPLDLRAPQVLTFSNKVAVDVRGAVIAPTVEQGGSHDILASHHPRLDFIRALAWLHETAGFEQNFSGLSISSSARVSPAAHIYDGVSIGEGSVIHPGAVLYPGTRIGKHCDIGANVIIGSDGFGYERLQDGTPVKFHHFAGVTIEDHVEIGPLTSISRGVFADTWIQSHVKIDAMVHIAHNCIVGRGAFVISTADLNGSVKIGNEAWIAPNSTVKNGIRVGAKSRVGLGAVVLRDVEDGVSVFGNPARNVPSQ